MARLLAGGYYDYSGQSIDEVLRAWVEDGAKVYDDSMPVMLTVREVWPFREYTWTRNKSRSGLAIVDGKRVTADGTTKWDFLKQVLKDDGWNDDDPLVLILGKNGKAKV